MTVKLESTAGTREPLEIRFVIKPTKIAQIWAKALSESIPTGLRERNRFDNFPNHEKGTRAALIAELEYLIQRLRILHPELKIPDLDRSNLQSSVNTLHFDFAHGHHVTQAIQNHNRELWSRFNVVLHAIESTLASDSLMTTGLASISSIVFTWNNSNRVPIPEDCFSEHTLLRTFGNVYANYSQVGRHFVEMFLSQDDSLADEHIQPARLIGGDTRIWLGPTNGHATALRNKMNLETWFAARAERFNCLGHRWGDPKLSLGVIPVGRLEMQLETPEEINRFVLAVGEYDTVAEVAIV